jgi:hypothetical protein
MDSRFDTRYLQGVLLLEHLHGPRNVHSSHNPRQLTVTVNSTKDCWNIQTARRAKRANRNPIAHVLGLHRTPLGYRFQRRFDSPTTLNLKQTVWTLYSRKFGATDNIISTYLIINI